MKTTETKKLQLPLSAHVSGKERMWVACSHIYQEPGLALFLFHRFLLFWCQFVFIFGHVAVLFSSLLSLAARSGQRTFFKEYTSILPLKLEVTY